MNFLFCPNCNMIFLPHETHYCLLYYLPSGRNATNSNVSFSTREQSTKTTREQSTQTTPYFSNEVYHQSAIYNPGFVNTSSNLGRVTSESQEITELNSDLANTQVGIQQMSGYSCPTDGLSDVYSDNMMNDRRMISNKEQISANTVSIRQSPIGSKASDNLDFSTSREDTQARDSPLLAIGSNSKEKCYVCPVCHKKFPHKSNLITHSSVHSNERPFICDVCGKSFRLKQHLKSHKILLGHNPPSDASSSRENSCSVCGKVLPSKSHLESHAKMHTGERPFVCDICNKAFKHKWNLNIHSLLHSDSHFHECHICKKVFLNMNTLNSHYIVHSAKKWFQCEVCENVYTRKSNLNRHRLKHQRK